MGQSRMLTKAQLREQMRDRLKRQGEEEKQRKSLAVWQKLSRVTAFRKAAMVCSYVSLSYEVQTWQMIEAMLSQGKRVAVPAVEKTTDELAVFEIRDPRQELSPGAYNVPEPVASARRPVALESLDLVLVPGLAFDRRGNRLGTGKGYYDRFLARVPERVPCVGLAFSFQVLDCLPTEAHDHAVHRVLTD